MSFRLSEFNWQLILIIITVSAVVSYMGDYLGMKIGKRRISLFGLRPKYTSTVITLCTGIGVAVLTLGVAAGTSESVRGAFFAAKMLGRQVANLNESLRLEKERLESTEFQAFSAQQDLEAAKKELLETSSSLTDARDKLQTVGKQAELLEKEKQALSKQLVTLKKEKEDTEKSVATLRAQSVQLARNLAQMKEGRLLAFGGELLSQTSVESGATTAELEAAMKRLVQTAEETLILRRQETTNSSLAPKVLIEPNSRKKTMDELSSPTTAGQRRVLRLIVPSNVVQGQSVTGIIKVYDSRLVFKEGTTLMTGLLDGGIQQSAAADALYGMLKGMNRKAVSAGVLQDPISGAVGNMDTLQFYAAVDKLSESRGEQRVTFTAARDIYTEGPVEIKITVVPKK